MSEFYEVWTPFAISNTAFKTKKAAQWLPLNHLNLLINRKTFHQDNFSTLENSLLLILSAVHKSQFPFSSPL